jgi:hypothetical protein
LTTTKAGKRKSYQILDNEEKRLATNDKVLSSISYIAGSKKGLSLIFCFIFYQRFFLRIRNVDQLVFKQNIVRCVLHSAAQHFCEKLHPKIDLQTPPKKTIFRARKQFKRTQRRVRQNLSDICQKDFDFLQMVIFG